MDEQTENFLQLIASSGVVDTAAMSLIVQKFEDCEHLRAKLAAACRHPWTKTTARIVGDYEPFTVHADGTTTGCRIVLECECGEKHG